jgi:hypothetical protein
MRFPLTIVLSSALMLVATHAAPECFDSCRLGAEQNGAQCQLWDSNAQTWQAQPPDGDGHLHNRARVHTAWLRERLMPAGGVMTVQFANDALTEIALYGNRRDSAIWTGIYLAVESLRVTAAHDHRRA